MIDVQIEPLHGSSVTILFLHPCKEGKSIDPAVIIVIKELYHTLGECLVEKSHSCVYKQTMDVKCSSKFMVTSWCVLCGLLLFYVWISLKSVICIFRWRYIKSIFNMGLQGTLGLDLHNSCVNENQLVLLWRAFI